MPLRSKLPECTLPLYECVSVNEAEEPPYAMRHHILLAEEEECHIVSTVPEEEEGEDAVPIVVAASQTGLFGSSSLSYSVVRQYQAG
jgi:hypothetical protein